MLAGSGHLTPLVVVAVGRRAPAVGLAEPFASRETAARGRLPLQQLLVSVQPAPIAAAA